MADRQFMPEGKDSMHSLPGAVDFCVEPAAVAGLGEHAVDPLAEVGPIERDGAGGDTRRASAASDQQHQGCHEPLPARTERNQTAWWYVEHRCRIVMGQDGASQG